MHLINQLLRNNSKINGIRNVNYLFYSTQTQNVNSDENSFRVLNLKQTRTLNRRRRDVRKQQVIPPPRTEQMPIDQDWGSVWPGPKTFHPASVPLPLRQGYTKKGVAPPGKFANAELMKIPNFLHLTPPIIKRQCAAIKKFCTDWPSDLEKDEQINEFFPMHIISSTYCHDSPTIRNPLSRIVTVKIPLAKIALDKHAKDKFLRLCKDNYNSETDEIVIVTDRCPLKQQNLDYAQYILVALFHESWKTESWESLKSEADMEIYEWNKSKSKETIEHLSKDINMEHVENYAKTVETLFNDGENLYNLKKYKEQVIKLLI